MPVSVGIIGYGSIAGYVAGHLHNLPDIHLSCVIARAGREGQARKVFGDLPKIISMIDALDEKPDLVLEVAGHGAVREHGPRILQGGIPLAIVSIGALAQDNLAEELEAAARQGETQLTLLSGAIGAIDALSSARSGVLENVSYRSRKPAVAWKGSKAEEICDLDNLTDAHVFYQGSARAAAQSYPKNANVAATVALAGLGLDNTNVELIADPTSSGNTHEVEASGDFGTFSFRITGKPLATNPKSSALTAMSAVQFLRNATDPIRV